MGTQLAAYAWLQAQSRWESEADCAFQPRAHSTCPSENRDIRQKRLPRSPDRPGHTSLSAKPPGDCFAVPRPSSSSCRWSYRTRPTTAADHRPLPLRRDRSSAPSSSLLAARESVQVYMPPTRTRARMKEEVPPSVSAATQASSPPEPPSSASRETIVTAPAIDTTPNTSPTFQAGSKTPSRRVLRLKCPSCSDYPDGFRSEHELRRHTNRVHRKTRKVWMTIDTSPDKSFLANCKSCQTGKRYNECYNAASHLRRMHFHPHKRGERKMTAAEARRGGKPGDLDPPMDVLKANWLREVDEILGDDNEPTGEDVDNASMSPPQMHPPPRAQPQPPMQAPPQIPPLLQPLLQPQPPALQQPTTNISDGKAPPTPTTPSTRSMAIDSIVDKMDAS